MTGGRPFAAAGRPWAGEGSDTEGGEPARPKIHSSLERAGPPPRGRGACVIAASFGLLMGLAACAEPGPIPGMRELIGKSELELITCAGQPNNRRHEQRSDVLYYLRRPGTLERSFAGTKGSQACPDHGCEARVFVRGGKVEEVEYYPFPDRSGACDHCDAIFRKCIR